ncbi:hypothetical protein [Terriglobus roseus]|uniref:Uncharacterized protein n=1 Tax=Terriglobus roseus TaxID=392734 RepID=A0A1H4NQ71_9BACT|nr:hypothetical protein [Terriglobus roseus]SEB97095.1 hypothetical protein SAMN05443244_2314 [Terriglobus roseus]
MSAACNVEFSYLYRDAGNFKQYGHVVFSNHSNATLKAVTDQLSAALIDGFFFEASAARVPDLFFDKFPFNPDLDHSWHEFHAIFFTDKDVDDAHRRDVSTFLEQMKLNG